jgi:hypothetical protein
MPRWTFLNSDWPADSGLPAGEPQLLERYQIQALSDIYRVVQSRLDSYRQSAAAIFIGVVAAILAFDSGFIHVIMGPEIAHPAVVGCCGLILLAIGLGGWYTIYLFGKYFGEMTGTAYKIDTMNRVWEPGVWIHGQALLPYGFRKSHKVGLCAEDMDLEGWFDPAIKLFARFTLFLAIVHGLVYAGLMVAAIEGLAVTSNSSVPTPGIVSPATHPAATPHVPPRLRQPKTGGAGKTATTGPNDG